MIFFLCSFFISFVLSTPKTPHFFTIKNKTQRKKSSKKFHSFSYFSGKKILVSFQIKWNSVLQLTTVLLFTIKRKVHWLYITKDNFQKINEEKYRKENGTVNLFFFFFVWPIKLMLFLELKEKKSWKVVKKKFFSLQTLNGVQNTETILVWPKFAINLNFNIQINFSHLLDSFI